MGGGAGVAGADEGGNDGDDGGRGLLVCACMCFLNQHPNCQYENTH